MNTDLDPNDGLGAFAWLAFAVAAAVIIGATVAVMLITGCTVTIPQSAQDALGGLIAPTNAPTPVPVAVVPSSVTPTTTSTTTTQPATVPAGQSAAYNEGYKAFRDGGTECPYSATDVSNKPWCAGWQQAFTDTNPGWTPGQQWHR